MRRAGSRKTLQLLSAAISNYRGVAQTLMNTFKQPEKFHSKNKKCRG
ncbi:MAG: hypothetical protein OJF50_002003 [Nitrospira sp.]|nr:hypothetical protein [Nitrospira sp.]